MVTVYYSHQSNIYRYGPEQFASALDRTSPHPNILFAISSASIPIFHPVVFWCCCAALVLQSGVQRVFPGIHSHCDVSAAQREALLAAAHGQVNLIIMLDVSASMGFNQGCDQSAGMMSLMRDSGE